MFLAHIESALSWTPARLVLRSQPTGESHLWIVTLSGPMIPPVFETIRHVEPWPLEVLEIMDNRVGESPLRRSVNSLPHFDDGIELIKDRLNRGFEALIRTIEPGTPIQIEVVALECAKGVLITTISGKETDLDEIRQRTDVAFRLYASLERALARY